MAYRLTASKYHLTYKTHLNYDTWLANVMPTYGDLKMWSFVHEVGDENEDNPTPYAHTHIFVWRSMNKPFDSINARYFDVDDEHPHINTKRGIDWAKTIVLKYHLGHKTKKDGKKYFIDPIFLSQHGVEDWKLEQEEFMIALNAPSLIEACLDLGFEPKSISDVKTIRAERKRTHDKLDDGLDVDDFIKIDPWPTSVATNRIQAVIGRGPMGIGKTNWALAQFTKPFKIEDLDELNDMPTDTDGIIFDECLFGNCSKKTMVCLTDYSQPRTVRTRNTNARIPAGIKKIFLCNEHELTFGNNPDTGGHEAILDRTHLMELTIHSIRSGGPL